MQSKHSKKKERKEKRFAMLQIFYKQLKSGDKTESYL